MLDDAKQPCISKHAGKVHRHATTAIWSRQDPRHTDQVRLPCHTLDVIGRARCRTWWGSSSEGAVCSWSHLTVLHHGKQAVMPLLDSSMPCAVAAGMSHSTHDFALVHACRGGDTLCTSATCTEHIGICVVVIWSKRFSIDAETMHNLVARQLSIRHVALRYCFGAHASGPASVQFTCCSAALLP